MKKSLICFFVLVGSFALAQDIANHSMPIGGGPGSVGWKTGGPCSAGQALVWSSVNADPACTSVGGGGGGTSPGGSSGQIQYNNAGTFGGFTAIGDATINAVTGAVVVSKAGGVAFGTAAFVATGTSGATIPLNNGNLTLSGNNTYSGSSTFSGTITSSNTNTFSGINRFTGHVALMGQQTVDVKSGANGCAAAVGNGSTDDQPAFQCQVDYLATNFDGGIIIVPKGNFAIGSTITMKKGVILQGISPNISGMTVLSDINMIRFDTSAQYGGMNNLWIFCNQTTGAGAKCVYVDANVPVHIWDTNIFGGDVALYTAGVDGYYENLNIQSTSTGGANVLSQGANWWVRCKIDNVNTTAYGFFQFTTGPGVAENHITQSDFSGSFTNASIYVDDGGSNSSVMVIESSVFTGAIKLINSQLLTIVGAEVGAGTAVVHSSGSLIISASYAFGGVSVSGGGTSRACAANINITC